MFRILYIALFVSQMAADQGTVQGSRTAHSYGLPMFYSSQNMKHQHFEAVGKKREMKRSFSSFKRRPSNGELKVNCLAQFQLTNSVQVKLN